MSASQRSGDPRGARGSTEPRQHQRHRHADTRSSLVFDTRALGRRAGAMTTVVTTVAAPGDLGIEVISVPEGAPIDLDLRFEAVVEGVLVTGTATMEAKGECVRCLTEVTVPLEVDVQELFLHETGPEDDEEASLMVGDLVDLEPVLRDDVVLDLPFQPLCSPDCAGLCPDCGVRLDDDPDHHHDDVVDPRWAALSSLQGDPQGDAVERDATSPYNRSGPTQGADVSR